MLFLRYHPDTSGSVAAPTRPDYWDCRGGMHGWEQDAVDPQQPSRAAELNHTRPLPASRVVANANGAHIISVALGADQLKLLERQIDGRLRSAYNRAKLI